MNLKSVAVVVFQSKGFNRWRKRGRDRERERVSERGAQRGLETVLFLY